MNFCVYVLYSAKIDRFYIGTTDDLNRRLDEHNADSNPSAFTYRGAPWVVFIVIEKLESKQAYDIERYLKSMKSSAYLKKIKDNPDVITWLKDKFK